MTALTPEQRTRERSIWLSIWLDTLIEVAMFTIALVGGSLTILAEAVRGTLGQLVEIYSLVVLRRIHRGGFVSFDFGVGKLEQACNLAIAVSMLVGAVWIGGKAVRLVLAAEDLASPFGLAMAAVFGALNTLLNYVAWNEVRKACRRGHSVIMQAQLRSRLTKLVSSLIVQTTMTVAALAPDPLIAAWADGLGAMFVAGYLMVIAAGMLRAGLPDLFDRSVDQATGLAIRRALEEHAGAYRHLERVRSRRSGSTTFVEIALAFDPGLQLADVHQRIAGIRAGVAREVEGADVSILAAPLRRERTLSRLDS
ncbi:MAG: cation diffusion facilitator family transporter [Geminicoccaceae bacterium]